ncbi:hypothetical protein KW794_02825 [Candidatus Saccharibacteria bacterium]|nr:hypothetical protein [Candidatus Saccharibacteria bacterium]
MTATNHALTGAALAMLIKRPELAIPAAFLSHFVLDAIPHYNPPKMTKRHFKNYQDAWLKKLKLRSFRIIFTTDMLLFLIVLLTVPLLAPSSVSPLTVLFSAFAGAAPDFDGGLKFLLRQLGLLRKKTKENDWFGRYHIAVQWMERPWGIYIEAIWFGFIIWAISRLIR